MSHKDIEQAQEHAHLSEPMLIDRQTSETQHQKLKVKGYYWMLAFVFFMSAIELTVKIITMCYPSLSIYYFLVLRSAVASACLLIYNHREIKHIMYDCVRKEHILIMIIRLALSAFIAYETIFAISKLPMFPFAVVICTTPLFTALFAMLLFDLKFEKKELVSLLLVLTGMIVLIENSYSGKFNQNMLI